MLARSHGYARLDEVAGEAFAAGMARFARRPTVDFELVPSWTENRKPATFHQGQLDIWEEDHDVLLALCGTQSGKTVFGPYWLRREIQRRGAGDYLIAGPSLELLSKKVVPEFKKAFREYGTLSSRPWVFTFSEAGLIAVFGSADEPCTVYFGHGDDPDSLESMTLKGAWADECGQKIFKQGSYEALQRRLAIHSGRLLLTTTPYVWNWVKSDIYDPYIGETAPHIKVINFASTMNPTFPVERYQRAKESMPQWKFEMMYDGKFTKPAGMIYDCFETTRNTYSNDPIKPNYVEVKDKWTKYSGHDFGPVNTAAVFASRDPQSGKIYVFRAYLTGGRTAEEHTTEFRQRAGLKETEDGWETILAWGGANSEDKTRAAFGGAGWPIQRPPVSNVDEGILRVYELLKSGTLVICDELTKLLEEIATYSWELDDRGEPIQGKIADKATYHRLDSLRYLVAALYEFIESEWGVADRFGTHDDEEEEEEAVNPFAALGWT